MKEVEKQLKHQSLTQHVVSRDYADHVVFELLALIVLFPDFVDVLHNKTLLEKS